MMVGDESIRRSAVDGRSECPWWAKLRRAESLIEEIRHASRRSTEQGVAGDCPGDVEEAVVYRIRLIEPISADFAVLGGDAIRNLRSSLDQVALSAGRAALWSAHRGCRANDGVTDPHLRRAVRRLGDFEEQTDEIRARSSWSRRWSCCSWSTACVAGSTRSW